MRVACRARCLPAGLDLRPESVEAFEKSPRAVTQPLCANPHGLVRLAAAILGEYVEATEHSVVALNAELVRPILEVLNAFRAPRKTRASDWSVFGNRT